MDLMEWFFHSHLWRQMHGQTGGETGVDNEMAEQGFANVGAWILGRNMFGPVRGPWPDESFDALVLLNVLEHIEDDLGAARQALRILRPGGFAVIDAGWIAGAGALALRLDVVDGKTRGYSVFVRCEEIDITSADGTPLRLEGLAS